MITTTFGEKPAEKTDAQQREMLFWYCCVDVSVSRQMLVTGDNMGHLELLSLDGQKIFSNKLHKAKVTHAEFNSRCDWLLATASVDHMVKLWDLRNIKDKNSFLHDMPHDRAVNSAYFNPLDCTKLLTTDQYDEIRVYSSPDWSKPQHIIQHPHRQFQHLTPIKATWHPVYDLIVAGRYPDDRVCPSDQRTIDIYDSNTAELAYQLHDPTVSGIKSINKFNPMGDVIGSGMGVTVLVWDRDESLISDRHTVKEGTSTSVGSLRGQRRGQQRSSRDRRGPALDAKLKKKLASLEEPETKTKTKTGCTKQKQAQMKKQSTPPHASWSSFLFWCQAWWAEYTMLSMTLSNSVGVRGLLLRLSSVVTICTMELRLLGMSSLILDRNARPCLIDAISLSSRTMFLSWSSSIPPSKNYA
ncbi:hypothetical protein INR49_010858 [Caranx melampygus]|nr:hypothetical protein INR49_010858 [Caranx melampygus]